MEAELSALLRQICNESYPSVAPEGTEAPYIVWQAVGGRELTTLDKKRVRRNSLVQITVWSDDIEVAVDLLGQVDAALRASTFLQASPSGAKRMIYERGTGLHGQMQDWSIWS